MYWKNNWNHNVWNKCDTFQLVMLATYIGLQIILVILGIYAIRINYWLWHVCPGSNYINPSSKRIATEATNWYEKIQWYPKVEKIIDNIYGPDITRIIIDYVRNIKIEQDEVMVSFDVTALFTSIDLSLAKETIANLLPGQLQPGQNLTKRSIGTLLDLCLSTCVKFDGKFYQQIRGTPMGSPVSGLIAEAVM